MFLKSALFPSDGFLSTYYGRSHALLAFLDYSSLVMSLVS